jgi:hypothetical protein
VNREIKEIEALVEELHKVASETVENKIREKISEWSKRYARHNFSGGIGHGSLILRVDPAVNSTDDIFRIDERHQLYHEAVALNHFILEIEDAIQINCVSDTTWIKTEKSVDSFAESL